MQHCSSQKYSSYSFSSPRCYPLFEDNLQVPCLVYFHIVKFTFIRNADWRDEESIFLSGLKVNSRNAKLYNNVGHALESQKKFSDALVLFKEAAKVEWRIDKTRRKSSSCFSGAARRHWGSHKHWASTKLFNQVLSLSISRQSPEKEFQV